MTFDQQGGRAKISRSKKIAETLARQIVLDMAEDYQAGKSLPSEALMLEHYGIGRASLREALRILEINGLISIKPGPGGGPVMETASPENFGQMATLYLHLLGATMGELHEALLIMEPILVRMSAEHQEESQLVRLRQNIEEAREIDLSNDRRYRDVIDEFHKLFSQDSGNQVLDLFNGALRSVSIHNLTHRTIMPARSRERVREEHERIAQAVFKGQAERAASLMREHVQRIFDYQMRQDAAQFKQRIQWR